MRHSEPVRTLKPFLALADYPGQLQKCCPRPVHYIIRRVRCITDIDGREAPHACDLKVFYDLASPELDQHDTKLGEERLFHLKRWWRLNRDSLLLLERHPENGPPTAVGVSIVLPLTDEAFRLMLGGERGVLGLTKGDLALLPGQALIPNLLIAGWYVTARWRDRLEGFAHALLIRHLSLFQDPAEPGRMRLLFVPSHRSLRTMLTEGLKSDGPFELPDSPHAAQMFIRPLPVEFGSDELIAATNKFLCNVASAQTWPLQ